MLRLGLCFVTHASTWNTHTMHMPHARSVHLQTLLSSIGAAQMRSHCAKAATFAELCAALVRARTLQLRHGGAEHQRERATLLRLPHHSIHARHHLSRTKTPHLSQTSACLFAF